MRVTGPGEKKKKHAQKEIFAAIKKTAEPYSTTLVAVLQSLHISQRFLCWKPNRQDAKSQSSYFIAISWKKKAKLKQTVLWHEYAKEC